jgi:hypothetical protein
MPDLFVERTGQFTADQHGTLLVPKSDRTIIVRRSPRQRRTGAAASYRFFDDDFRDELRLRDEDFFRGTFPPARRASERPIAIACLRLVTFFPDRPLLSVPRFRSCIAFSTFCDAFLPYLAIGPPRAIVTAVFAYRAGGLLASS